MAVAPRSSPLGRFVLFRRQWPALLAAICVLSVDAFNSFGLEEASDIQAAAITDVLAAPFYGGADRIGQRSVTVVLIDQPSVDFEHWTTPIAYSDQGNIISAIAQYQPAAIFMDFKYDRPHGENASQEIARLRDQVQGLSAAYGFPIMIGGVSDAPELAPLRDIPAVGVEWHAQSWMPYPMRGDGDKEMAASALYRAWCGGHRGGCPSGGPPPADANISLTWGFGASPLVADNVPPGCVLPDTRWPTRLWAMARNTWSSFLGQSGIQGGRGCVYTDTINAAMLLTQGNEAVIERLVRGRVVLVGASYRASGDLQIIPNVGIVPGVYVHATAVDNLIEEGPNYLRPPPDLIGHFDWPDAIETGLALALYLLALVVLERKTPDGGDQHGRRAALIYAVLGLGLIVGATAVENALHWPPLNVLGVVVFVFAVFEYVHSRSKRLESA